MSCLAWSVCLCVCVLLLMSVRVCSRLCRRVWDWRRQSTMGSTMYIWFLQFANVQKRETVLAELSTELPAKFRLSLLLLRAAERESPDHVQLAASPAVRYPVTTEFRLLLTSLLWAHLNFIASEAFFLGCNEVWPQNKWVSRNCLGTFVCHVWWSWQHRRVDVGSACVDMHQSPKTGVLV